MASLLLSALVERFDVSRMRDFFCRWTTYNGLLSKIERPRRKHKKNCFIISPSKHEQVSKLQRHFLRGQDFCLALLNPNCKYPATEVKLCDFHFGFLFFLPKLSLLPGVRVPMSHGPMSHVSSSLTHTYFAHYTITLNTQHKYHCTHFRQSHCTQCINNHCTHYRHSHCIQCTKYHFT